MNILDRARIVGATVSYDLWLELAGVPGRRRRDLRRELRANLRDATALVGSHTAVRYVAAHAKWPQQQTPQTPDTRVGQSDSPPVSASSPSHCSPKTSPP